MIRHSSRSFIDGKKKHFKISQGKLVVITYTGALFVTVHHDHTFLNNTDARAMVKLLGSSECITHLLSKNV